MHDITQLDVVVSFLIIIVCFVLIAHIAISKANKLKKVNDLLTSVEAEKLRLWQQIHIYENREDLKSTDESKLLTMTAFKAEIHKLAKKLSEKKDYTKGFPYYTITVVMKKNTYELSTYFDNQSFSGQTVEEIVQKIEWEYFPTPAGYKEIYIAKS